MRFTSMAAILSGVLLIGCSTGEKSVNKPINRSISVSPKSYDDTRQGVANSKLDVNKSIASCDKPKYTEKYFLKSGVRFVKSKPKIKYDPYGNFGLYIELYSRYSLDYQGQDFRWLRARGILRERRRKDNCLKRYVLFKVNGNKYAFAFDMKNSPSDFFYVTNGVYVKMNYEHVEVFWRHDSLSFKEVDQLFNHFGVQVWHEKEGLLFQQQHSFQLPPKSNINSNGKAVLKDDIAMCKFNLKGKVTKCQYKTGRGFSLD